MSGNDGTDYVVIEATPEGMCHIEIGHCCVVILDKVVPIEWLTGLFGALTSEFCKNIKDNPTFVLYDRFNDWLEPFKSETRSKLQ